MTPLRPAPKPAAESLEPIVAEVEARLAGLAASLLERDHRGVDAAANELQRALAQALDAFAQAAHRGGVPMALRQRLVSASGQVAAQRETLARATAALDRAMEILLPRQAAVYNASGGNSFASGSGVARA
jgi:hypothetical protein